MLQNTEKEEKDGFFLLKYHYTDCRDIEIYSDPSYMCKLISINQYTGFVRVDKNPVYYWKQPVISFSSFCENDPNKVQRFANAIQLALKLQASISNLFPPVEGVFESINQLSETEHDKPKLDCIEKDC